MIMNKASLLISLVLIPAMIATAQMKTLREHGLTIGLFPAGQNNAITDVKGVKVGQVTKIKGQDMRTGVTAILPHEGNIFQEKVPAAIFIGNGFGKLAGYSQVKELGTLETPIVLTNTLNVPIAADALIDYTFSYPENENVHSLNSGGWRNQ